MAAKPRDGLTYLEIYRPVTGGLDEFQANVLTIGMEVFGTVGRSTRTGPVIACNEMGQLEPVMAVEAVSGPKIEVYDTDSLRLSMLDRRALKQLSYGGAFRYAIGKLTKGVNERPYSPIARNPEEQEARLEERRKQSLMFIFRQIGLQYGIEDQSHIELTSRALDQPVEPILEHLGEEISLVLHSSKAARMLCKQAGVSLMRLGDFSKKAAYPYSPTSLRVPFARIPTDASEEQKDHFIDAVMDCLPVRFAVGAAKYNISESM